MPPNKSHACDYIDLFAFIAICRNFPVDQVDKSFVMDCLKSCPAN